MKTCWVCAPARGPTFPFRALGYMPTRVLVIHLVGHGGQPDVGSVANLKLEHFTFSATGSVAFAERFNRSGQAYQRIELKKAVFVQFHLRDSDGNQVCAADIPTVTIKTDVPKRGYCYSAVDLVAFSLICLAV